MRTRIDRQKLVGLLLLLVGIAFFIRFTDIVPAEFPDYLFSWKTFLIALGLIFFITEKSKITGTILILLGTIFLLSDIYGISSREILKYLIPAIFIGVGMILIFKGNKFKRSEFNVPEGEDSNDFLNDLNLFGGAEKKVNSKSFKGGRLTCIFGGTDIDLRKSELAPGINALDMVCIFGGFSFRIPEDWKIKNDVTAIFGGFSDERLIDADDKSEKEDEKVLYLKGFVLFGGGEIK